MRFGMLAAAAASCVLAAPASAATKAVTFTFDSLPLGGVFYGPVKGKLPLDPFGNATVVDAGIGHERALLFGLDQQGGSNAEVASFFTRYRPLAVDYLSPTTGTLHFRNGFAGQFATVSVVEGWNTIDLSGYFPVNKNGYYLGFNDGNYTIDNFTAGVPEPATWALMILGFGAVAGAMRTKRRPAIRLRSAAH